MGRFVESEHDLNQWTKCVGLDKSLPRTAKLTLIGISLFIDHAKWQAEVTQASVADALNESRSTLNAHWKTAVKGPYVTKIGSHEYKAGNRTMLGPTVRLTIPD